MTHVATKTPIKRWARRIRARQRIWLYFLIAVALVIVGYLHFTCYAVTSELLLAVLSGLFAAAFFLHRSHAEDARFFRELFEGFNSRYDKLNNRLCAIAERKEGELTLRERITVIDYFNLCCEEYLFYQLGYIYPHVWRSWERGMRQYGQNSRIAKLWREQQATDSYYGFEFPVS